MPGLVMLLLAAVAIGLIARFRWYRIDRPLRRPEVLPAPGSIMLAFAMFLLGVIGVQAAVRMAGLSAEAASSTTLADQAKIALGAAVGQAVVAAIYLARLRESPRGSRGGRAGRRRAALVGVAALVLVWPLLNATGMIVAAAVERLGGPAPETVAHDTLRAILESPRDGWFWLIVGLVLVATPALEELLYRGLLQDAFRRIGLGPWVAIVITSGVFALMHVGNSAPHAVAGLFVLSLAFGWSFERTGRLTAPIAMHVLFNAVNLALALATHS